MVTKDSGISWNPAVYLDRLSALGRDCGWANSGSTALGIVVSR